MSTMNRMGNCYNIYQQDIKKVLCVCSAGLLRSPTTAVVLSQEPYNYNTRAVGASTEYALIPIDEVLLAWADEVVCMEEEHMDAIYNNFPKYEGEITVLGIPDRYAYRDKELVELIKERYEESLETDKDLQVIKEEALS